MADLPRRFSNVLCDSLNAFDGAAGRSLVANLSFIGFSQIPGGIILYWAYQILAVGLLAAASTTAFQDLQATEWRDVAIGEIPEIIVYRDKRGTFTRSVTIAYILVIIITVIIRGKTALGIPYYGIGVFMPIMMMGFAIRKHILKTYPKGAKRSWGAFGAGFAAILSGIVFVGQIVGKWTEGGWIVLISFSILVLTANLVLISPTGYREPKQIYRIVRQRRAQGAMASIVEWQSLKMQEYRYNVLVWDCQVLRIARQSDARSGLSHLLQRGTMTMPCTLTTPKPHHCFNSIWTANREGQNWVVHPKRPSLGMKRENKI